MRGFLKKIFLFLVVSSLTLACGGGAGSGTSSETTQSLTASGVLTGGAGLLPIPEDIYDLPNTLPDNFGAMACPTSATKPISKDLIIRLSANPESPARYGTYQGTGAIFVSRNAANPATIALDVRSASNVAYSISTLPHSALDYVNVGRIYGGNGQLMAPASVDWGDSLPSHSFVENAGPAYQVIRTSFIPGFAGDNFNMGLPINGLEGNLPVGAYAFAIVFDAGDRIVCTLSSMLLVVE